jgi:FtsP/CotA-like multicopper oxidase with cupredoxin domain
MLELAPVRSPFGVAVAPDGRLRHHLVARVESLPPPATLGNYTHYVAWGYDLALGDERRLGVVGNGRSVLGELPHERFRLLVSAERSAAPARRTGRLVLRATSPSALMVAHRDAMSWLPGAGGDETGAHGAHQGHEGAGWPPPPADPRIAPSPMQHPPPSVAPWRMDTTGAAIAAATPRQVVSLRDGDTLRLAAGFVRRQVGSRSFVLYGYNGQVPGPLVRVRQGTEVVVRFVNGIDLPSTVHWHGLRLDPQFDGVPHLSQEPVAPGDSFTYRLRFPDAGIYWYHPHVREDIQQEMGLYGNLMVSRRAAQRVRVHHEEVLALDDFLVGDDGSPYPLGREAPSHALMGRFGNQLLVNGEPSYALQVQRGAVVRFYLTNVASARVFNLRIPGARLKLVGSDLGDFEREEWVQSIVLAPAERYVVEARFDSAGRHALVNAVQWLDHMRGTVVPVQDTMGVVTVSEAPARPDLRADFDRLGTHPEVSRELAPFRRHFDRPVDHTVTLAMHLTGVAPSMVAMLVGVAVPLDWNDAMPMLNAALSGREVQWTMRDESGRENMAIDWRFPLGSVARVRLVNDPTATHAMAHPIHFHGQRFLVIERNGVRTTNLSWKDTAVLPAGETMDLLLDLSNPGRWMFHCHIAEHLGTGMMGTFTVTAPP